MIPKFLHQLPNKVISECALICPHCFKVGGVSSVFFCRPLLSRVLIWVPVAFLGSPTSLASDPWHQGGLFSHTTAARWMFFSFFWCHHWHHKGLFVTACCSPAGRLSEKKRQRTDFSHLTDCARETDRCLEIICKVTFFFFFLPKIGKSLWLLEIHFYLNIDLFQISFFFGMAVGGVWWMSQLICNGTGGLDHSC